MATMCRDGKPLRLVALAASVVLSLLILLSPPTYAATGCQGAADADHCQYNMGTTSGAVTKTIAAPAPTTSAGVRQNAGINYVVYDNRASYGICRVVSNGTTQDIFVPQGGGSANDFTQFITNPPANVTIQYCIDPVTTTASPNEAASYEIDAEQGAILNPSGTVANITGILVPSVNVILPFTGPGQTTAMSTTDGNANHLIAFTYTRSDCTMATAMTPPQKVCNTWYVQERQTITMKATAKGTGLTGYYDWETPSVTSDTWWISSSPNGAWTSIGGPNYDYRPPTVCPPGYSVGSTWSVTTQTPEQCPAGFTGTYTQTTTTPYICQANGLATTNGSSTITDDKANQCLPFTGCNFVESLELNSGPTSPDQGSPQTSKSINLGQSYQVTTSDPWNYMTWSNADISNTGSAWSKPNPAKTWWWYCPDGNPDCQFTPNSQGLLLACTAPATCQGFWSFSINLVPADGPAGGHHWDDMGSGATCPKPTGFPPSGVTTEYCQKVNNICTTVPSTNNCPAIDFSSTGTITWAYHSTSYCKVAGNGWFCPGWNTAEPYAAGFSFPGPANFTGYTAGLYMSPNPGGVGDNTWGSPLFPDISIYIADHAAGVPNYETYPGSPTNLPHIAGYVNLEQDGQTFVEMDANGNILAQGSSVPVGGGQYTPNDSAVAYGVPLISNVLNQGGNAYHNFETLDLFEAVINAFTVPVMYVTPGSGLVYPACDDQADDVFSTCVANLRQYRPGGNGQLVTNTDPIWGGKYTYASGDTWSFQAQRPGGGSCFYDAGIGNIGKCNVTITFKRAQGSSSCNSLPNNPYCGAENQSGPSNCGNWPRRCTLNSQTPQAPNTDPNSGPQVCNETCECENNL